MFTDDYSMRQIEMLSRSIAKVVFDKDTNTVDLIRQDDVGGSLSEKEEGMLSKIQDLDINGAENDLYEMLEEGLTPGKLKLALWFYTQLRSLSDEALEKADFSREEIDEGLEGVFKMYHIES